MGEQKGKPVTTWEAVVLVQERDSGLDQGGGRVFQRSYSVGITVVPESTGCAGGFSVKDRSPS